MDRRRSLLMATLAAVIVTTLWTAPAAAGARVEEGPDGTVVATVELDLPLATVRAALDFEVLHPTRSPDVVRAEVLSQRGGCDEVASTVRGGPVMLEYTALRCPTADGWEVDLLRSEDMTALSVEWRLSQHESTTRLVFSIRSSAALPVPAALQQRMLRRSALATVERFERTVIGG